MFHTFYRSLMKRSKNLSPQLKSQPSNSNLLPTQLEQTSFALSKSPELLADRIYQLNRQAEKKMNNKEYSSALSSLKVGEKMLEYVAESCRDVKKELIIVILHNIVCVSQMLWDLQSASDYLEGIIYNLEITSNSKSSRLMESRSLSKLSNLISETSETFDQKDEVVRLRYYLQYCAINSSLDKHRNAETAARKACKLSMIHLQTLEKDSKKYIIKSSTLKEASSKLTITTSLISEKMFFDSDLRKEQLFVLIWGLHQGDCNSYKKHEFKNDFKALSIGNIMTLSFKNFREERLQTEKLEQSQFYMFLLISLSFFSLSTEMGLNQGSNQNQVKNHHFLSIMLYLLFVPFESPYLYYLLETYNKKYTKIPLKTHQKKKHIKDLVDLLKSYKQSYDLPQQSVATPVMYKRMNERTIERVKVQSKRLKQILQFDIKHQKTQNKSKGSKAQSLSISKNKLNKLSFDDKIKKGGHNRTDFSIEKKQQSLQKGVKAKLKTCKNKINHQECVKDEVGERYFALAFEKGNNIDATKEKKGDSGRSSSETKDRSSSNHTLKLQTPKYKKSPLKNIKSKRKLKF